MADNKEMKTLGGYEIVDEKARQDINIVAEKADEAYSLAKGATKAFVYDTYSDMIVELNVLDKAELLVNFHVMIREVCVPDLWISGVSDEHVEYTYTSNEDFIADLTEDGIVQVGYYVLSALETQKVDLSEYVKNTDYATSTQAGLVKTNPNCGVNASADGGLTIIKATDSDIDSRTNTLKPIVPSNLEYAVMKALSDSKLEWTDEQKQLARALLGAIGSNNVHAENGLAVLGNGQLIISPPIHSLIDDRDKDSIYSQRRAVTLSVLDYAVKKALSDCKLTGGNAWTDEEKAKALELLGGVKKPTTGDGVLYFDSGLNMTVVKITDGTVASAYQIPRYAQGGVLPVGTPTTDAHATTKKYVDDGFVGKVTTETDIQQAYVKGADGSQKMVNVTNISQANTIVERDGSGNFYVSAPTLSSHVTTKKYVDDLVGSVESILTELHTYAQTKIGGEA